MYWKENALQWYELHSQKVDEKMKQTDKALMPPKEDLLFPQFWKPEHWKWLFNGQISET